MSIKDDSQYHMATHPLGTHRRVLEAFEEIQSSGNPLTAEEVEKLIAKRPARYAALKGKGIRNE